MKKRKEQLVENSAVGGVSVAEKREQLRLWTSYERKWKRLRLTWMEKAEKDPKVQKAVTEMVENSLEAFFNLMVWTFDPRLKAKGVLPMILYPFQRTHLQEIEKHYQAGQDLLTEKSRDMGATWLFAGWATHKWLFESNFSFLWGSRKEEAVDNNTTESIFGKHDFLIARLPDWLPGVREYRSTPRNRLKRPSILIRNPSNGNTIAGESTNENFSRSGRYSAIGLDEFAFWDVDRLAWGATADSSPVRFPLSTPNGRGNQFADLRFPNDQTDQKIDVSTLHWSKHPLKDHAWYEREKGRRESQDLAREVDISYEKSAHGRIYKDFDRIEMASEQIDYDPNLQLWRAWDFGIGTTGILWIQVAPPHQYYVIDEYEEKGADIDHFIEVCRRKTEEIGYGKEFRDAGDPAGTHRTQVMGALSVIDRLAQAGIFVETPDKGLCGYENRIRQATLILKCTKISKTCTHFVNCLENYRNKEEVNPMKPESPRPVINWASHLPTAFEYFSLLQPTPDLGDLTMHTRVPIDWAKETGDWALDMGRWSEGSEEGKGRWR